MGLGSNEPESLRFLEKMVCIFTGPVTGLLPPRLQRKLGEFTGNDYHAATYMSLSSRVFNALWVGYGLASVMGKLAGVDIDPTPMDAATWASIPIALDSAVREFANGARYAMQGGNYFTDYNVPWGEPILSVIDSTLNPEWYGKKRLD